MKGKGEGGDYISKGVLELDPSGCTEGPERGQGPLV